ncbi:hypothetical protein P4O66_012605, partial [Electrophorus voltai]
MYNICRTCIKGDSKEAEVFIWSVFHSLSLSLSMQSEKDLISAWLAGLRTQARGQSWDRSRGRNIWSPRCECYPH